MVDGGAATSLARVQKVATVQVDGGVGVVCQL